MRTVQVSATLTATLFLAAVALAYATSPVHALSCARPDVTRSFNFWSQAPQEYVLVRGSLTPLGAIPKVPKGTDINSPPTPPPADYRFSGVLLGKSANTPWRRTVTVAPKCTGPWCSGYPDASEAIMAFEKRGNSYIFSDSACGGNRFSGNLAAVEAAVKACLNGTCPPEGPVR